jgi:tRNA threonylcarbamoyladenosine biosynthesis protein TsaB
VLAIDTTSEFGSLALVDGESIVEEVGLHSTEGFSALIFGEIQALLSRRKLSLTDLDGFAAASGPGSFTGVRVGLTAVKGLAEAIGRKVAAVSNLQALAWFGTRALRAPVLDARRGEIYGAVYDAGLEPVCEEVVAKFEDWLAMLPPEAEIVTGRYTIPADTGRPVVQAPNALAGAIGRIAVRRFPAGQAQRPDQIDANYVRRPDAELLWRQPGETQSGSGR